MATRVQMESAERLSDSVTELLRKQPFFGSLALRLPLRADPSRETLAADGHEIRYSPRWIADTDAHLIETAMARVVMACALKHHTRRAERDPERWQHASQLVTHALLRDAGFTLPPEAQAWDDLSVEQAYDRLPEPDEDGGGEDGASSPPPGAGGAAGPQAGDDGEADSPSDSSDGGDGDSEEDSSDDSGSDAPPSHDPSGTGEIMDAGARAGDGDDSGEAPFDVNAEEQAWDEAMHQALNLARAEGKLPGGVEDTVKGAHASTLDPYSLLRRYMTDTARRDYSWSQPNRRFIDSGLYLPAMHSEAMGTIVILLDTSGSIYSYLDILARFWTEVCEVVHELNPERLIVLQVDTRVADVAEYASEELPDALEAKGGGGTDFRPGFAWLEAEGIEPACCLYFTDMQCSSYPETEPGFPVIWANYGNPPSDWNREPWGERVDIAAEGATP